MVAGPVPSRAATGAVPRTQLTRRLAYTPPRRAIPDDAHVGRPFCRRDRPPGRRIHALDRGRPRAGARRPGWLGRARAWPGASRPRDPDEEATLVAGLEGLADEVATGTFAWDASLEDVHLNLEAALAARDRAGRREAPYRPVAQRPGRPRPPALAATFAGGHRRSRRSTSSGPWSSEPSEMARRSCPA